MFRVQTLSPSGADQIERELRMNVDLAVTWTLAASSGLAKQGAFASTNAQRTVIAGACSSDRGRRVRDRRDHSHRAGRAVGPERRPKLPHQGSAALPLRRAPPVHTDGALVRGAHLALRVRTHALTGAVRCSVTVDVEVEVRNCLEGTPIGFTMDTLAPNEEFDPA
jgi:hypothetical protein